MDTGVLTQTELDAALVVQRTDRRRLGEILVERGVVHPQELAQLLSHQLSCPWISLAQVEIAPDVLAMLPAAVALEHSVLPVHMRVAQGQRVLYVATDDPTDDDALTECAIAAGIQVRPMVAVTSDVRAALARWYEGRQAAATEPPASEVPETVTLPKPPPPPRVKKQSVRVSIEEDDLLDVIDIVEDKPREKRAPTVLVLNAPEPFLEQCRAAGKALSATLVDGAIMRAGDLVAEHRPCAIVVTDDVYAFDRTGLNRLALDNDAHLVVWSEDVDGRQLEPLLAGAIDRWGRSSYEKGAIVDGRYELLRDLGADTSQNGSARWEVRNVRTARRSLLALAVRSEGGEDDAQAIRREQKSLARITHPGAVELRDAGTTELGDPYIVLEPLEGRTLEGLLAARTKLVTEELCALVLQVADVLGAAHAVGVTHRRVVSENIVVARDGYGLERVKLIGWGASSVADPASLDIREDLSALGVCAFEALTGRRPKTGEDVSSAGLPELLAPVIARAMARDASAFASAKELAHAFQAATGRARERTQLLEASPRDRDVATSGRPPPPGSAGPEQRRFARAAYRTPVRVEVPGIGAVDGRSEDISSGGLLVVSRSGLKGGTEVTLRFALPLDGRIVSESAFVKWSRAARSDDSSGMSAMGVELRSPGPETLRQIERYVSLMGDGSETTFPK